MTRFLVVFAREPLAQAREKGLPSRGAASLFLAFAAGWREAAARAGARLLVATPPEDVERWRRVLPGAGRLGWIRQRGTGLGSRLEDTARRVAALGGHSIIVGGDVPPSPSALVQAFDALESGAQAVLAPARDGGVSLLALPAQDVDLLGRLRCRRRTVLAELVAALEGRGRRVELLGAIADLDGRSSLRAYLRLLPSGDGLAPLLRSILAGPRPLPAIPQLPARLRALTTPLHLRAPPALLAA